MFIYALNTWSGILLQKSGAVGWSVKHNNTLVSTPLTSSFGSVDRCQVLLEKEISIHKACQPMGAQSDPN